MNEIVPIILAAGRGQRLGIDHIPKPMVPIDGRPLMQGAVDSLMQVGFRPSQPHAVIGYRGEAIREYFGKDLRYVTQDTLNGNAGAVQTAFEDVEDARDKHILTIQGDDADQATPANLQRVIDTHTENNAVVTVLTVSEPDPAAHKIMYIHDTDGRVRAILPRNTHDMDGQYTAGVYMFTGAFLDDYLPQLRDITPEGKELGIGTLIRLAHGDRQRVFLARSDRDYTSVNTPRGLERLRERSLQTQSSLPMHG